MRPFMRAWYRSREAALESVPFPEDAPVARAPGHHPIRVLVVGNGAATGWGVRSHDLALTGQLARALARSLDRGTQVDARVDPDVRLAGLPRLLADVDLARYDAVVVVAGTSDALSMTPLPLWHRSMEAVLDLLREDAPAARVLVLGSQPIQSISTYAGWPGGIADRHRAALNRITMTLCAERGVGFTELPAPSGGTAQGHRSPAAYAEWAQHVAHHLGPDLRWSDAAGSTATQPEDERQRATAALRPDAPADPRLDRITGLARQVFGVDVAAVTLLDGDLQKHRSIVGAAPAAIPRSESICDRTVRGDGPLVVGDLAADPRFAGLPLVVDGLVRFYAGYPIESPDGYRVGAFCILDPSPRDAASVDTDALSALALLAQKELWASADRVPAVRADR